MNRLRSLLTTPDRIWPKFLFIFVAVFIINTLFGNGLTEAGLSFPANFNYTIESLWLAELITFAALLPILLLWPCRKYGQKVITFIVLGVVALLVLTFFIGADNNDCYPHYPGGGLACGRGSITYTLQRSLYYHTFDGHDYLLESILPRFIDFQAPFVLGVVVSYLGYTAHQNFRRKR